MAKKEENKPAGPSLNPVTGQFRRKISLPNVDDLVKGIRSGNRIMLGKAITLIESTRSDHQQIAREVVEACLPYSGRSLRIGVTGPPGVGKSTFLEAFGKLLTSEGKSIAVLAVDPSSQRSGGSILGDKTRMQELSKDPLAFIRPSPAGQTLGGVARQTRETVLLCEAAGYEYVLIETVGVGQSETAVQSMTDLLLLLLLPGAGDELQGIKRGIVEMADLIAVNKAEGDRLPLAKQAKREYRNALHLFPPQESGWTPRVEICSAMEGSGLPEILSAIREYESMTRNNGFFDHKRSEQALYWLEESIRLSWQQLFRHDDQLNQAYSETRNRVANGDWTPIRGANFLLDQLFNNRTNTKKSSE